ncbi:olfactory receptor 14I1-like [Rissa tridactyla]|uniref:olfactory receptor 14I1-like n=1 Tax=Rissa tridactyla TaxID=75485 RepID=UPI0023BAB693|nr:olfactory receptor 14I1-like [Rissa tridactyla]XP_054039316.1 olfactory receptor 14I1-like [Rissa tridactyla]
MSNNSSITQFLLLPLADTWELQLLHFWLFLAIYLAALLGNSLMVSAVACDHHLHNPMYFFLFNLSLLDLGSSSTTVPKSMANSLWDVRDISYYGCVAQAFCFLFLAGGEYFLLTVMAYDRYVAICKPLNYRTPPSTSSRSLDLLMAVLYSLLPPALNPLIYSMRNQELKDTLKKLVQKQE